jgi:hypothetical protein
VDFFDPAITFIDSDPTEHGYILWDTLGHRKRVPGITQMLAPHFFQNKVPRGIAGGSAIQEGDIIHAQLAEYFAQKSAWRTMPMHPKAREIVRHVEQRFPHWQYTFEPEVKVSDYRQYASSIDLIVTHRDTHEVHLIDYKTGSSNSLASNGYVAAQLSVYKKWANRPVVGLVKATTSGLQEVNPVKDSLLEFYLTGKVTHQYNFKDDLPKFGVNKGIYLPSTIKERAAVKKGTEQTYVVFDVETARNQVIAIAARKVMMRPGVVQPVLVSSYVRYYEYKGQRDSTTEPVHGLTPEVLQYLNSKHPKTQAKSRYYDAGELQAFRSWVGNSALITANGISFDIPIALKDIAPAAKTREVRWASEGEMYTPLLSEGNYKATNKRAQLRLSTKEWLREAEAAVRSKKKVRIRSPSKDDYGNVFDMTLEMQRVYGSDISDMNKLNVIYKRVIGKSMEADGMDPHNAESDVDALAKVFFELLKQKGEESAVSKYFRERTTGFVRGSTFTHPPTSLPHLDQEDLDKTSRAFLLKMNNLSRDQRAAIADGLARIYYDPAGKLHLEDIKHWSDSMYQRGIGNMAEQTPVQMQWDRLLEAMQSMRDIMQTFTEVFQTDRSTMYPKLDAAFALLGEDRQHMSLSSIANGSNAAQMFNARDLPKGYSNLYDYLQSQEMGAIAKLKLNYGGRVQSKLAFDEALEAAMKPGNILPPEMASAIYGNSKAAESSIFDTFGKAMSARMYTGTPAAKRANRTRSLLDKAKELGIYSTSVDVLEDPTAFVGEIGTWQEYLSGEIAQEETRLRGNRTATKLRSKIRKSLSAADAQGIREGYSYENVAGIGRLSDAALRYASRSGVLDEHLDALKEATIAQKDLNKAITQAQEVEKARGKKIMDGAVESIGWGFGQASRIVGARAGLNYGGNVAEAWAESTGRIGSAAQDLLGPFGVPFIRATTAAGESKLAEFLLGPAQEQARNEGMSGFGSKLLGGVASGAMTGFSIGGVPGAIVGTVVGVIAGGLMGAPDVQNIGYNVESARIRGVGNDVASRLNMWSAVFDIGKSWLNASLKMAMIPINFFGTALKSLGSLLGRLVGLYGTIGSLGGQYANPPLRMAASTYSIYQDSRYLDIAMGNQPGSFFGAAAGLKQKAMNLINAGVVDEEAMKFGAIGNFLDAIIGSSSEGEAYQYALNLAEEAKGFTPEQMAMLQKVFPEIASVAEFGLRRGINLTDAYAPGQGYYNGEAVTKAGLAGESAFVRLITIFDNFKNTTLNALATKLGSTFIDAASWWQKQLDYILNSGEGTIGERIMEVFQKIEWGNMIDPLVNVVHNAFLLMTGLAKRMLPTVVQSVDDISRIVHQLFIDIGYNIVMTMGPLLERLGDMKPKIEFSPTQGLSFRIANAMDTSTWTKAEQQKWRDYTSKSHYYNKGLTNTGYYIGDDLDFFWADKTLKDFPEFVKRQAKLLPGMSVAEGDKKGRYNVSHPEMNAEQNEQLRLILLRMFLGGAAGNIQTYIKDDPLLKGFYKPEYWASAEWGLPGVAQKLGVYGVVSDHKYAVGPGGIVLDAEGNPVPYGDGPQAGGYYTDTTPEIIKGTAKGMLGMGDELGIDSGAFRQVLLDAGYSLIQAIEATELVLKGTAEITFRDSVTHEEMKSYFKSATTDFAKTMGWGAR